MGERGDEVLAGASLVMALLAEFAGFVLLFAAARLVGFLEIPGAPKEREWGAATVICGVGIFCFVEAYRFYRFYARPEVRDRYYARKRLGGTISEELNING